MRQWFGIPVAGALLLSACVTINVYFPAAEAKEAAREFVEKVIDQADKVEVKQTPAGGGGMAMLQRRFDFDPWMLVGIGSAQAQSAPDITIKTPAIQAIQARMESRFDASLRGVAFLAGVGQLWGSLGDAVATLQPGATFEPRLAEDARLIKRARWRQRITEEVTRSEE